MTYRSPRNGSTDFPIFRKVSPMSAELDLSKLDRRTVDRLIRTGQLDEKAWEKHVKGLPDVADKSAPVEAVLENDDFDDEDDDDLSEA